MTMKPPDGTLNAGTSFNELVRNGPYINASQVFFSLTDTDPLDELDVDLTTPESSQVVVARESDTDRLVSPDPGVYKWGLFAYEVNTGTAPVTSLAARARGQSVYTFSSSGRAYGKDPTIHGLEVTAGIHPSEATLSAHGTAVVDNLVVTQPGSRFEQGMAVTITGSGLSIPGGTTILSVAGRPGAPTSITFSNTVTGSGAGAVVAEPSGTTEAIGLLLTGNNGSAAATSLLNAAVQIQAQNAASHWQYGVNVGASGLQATGTAFRLASATADKALSVESCTLANGVYLSNTTFSGGAIALSGVTAASGLHATSSSVFSTAAIQLDAQNIATDTTTGMKIATNSTQKIGFYGKVPIVRPSATAVATDAASTQTLANGIRTALINLGLWA